MPGPQEIEELTKALQFGKRIVVAGRGGKTSLGQSIGERFSLPFLELDSVVWLPGWKSRDRAGRTEIIERWIDDHPGGWVIDGETVDTSDRQLTNRADMVIWLDLPFSTVFWRVFFRSIRRIRSHEQICGENFESWRHSFLSSDSLALQHMVWLVNGRWRRHRQRLAVLLKELCPEQIGVRIRTASELDRFYEQYGLALPDSSFAS